jgi:hypothetical protein
MPTVNQPSQTALRILATAALLGCCAIAQAESANGIRERQRTYQTDRQRCLSGQTGQSQASCLQEAGAVLQQPPSQQGEVSADVLAKNALQRCDAFADDARQSCIARMRDDASVQGSAATGGILRELSEPGK